LAGTLVEIFRYNLTHVRDKRIRAQHLWSFLALFMKHEWDTRWKEEQLRRKVFSIYLPFIRVVMSHVHQFRDDERMAFDERRHIGVCVLSILKNMDPELLKVWWRNESPTNSVAFFQLLIELQSVFENRGEKKLTALIVAAVGSNLQATATKTMLENFYYDTASTLHGRHKRNLREERAKAKYGTGQKGKKGGTIGPNTLRHFRVPSMSMPKVEGYVYHDKLETCLTHECSMVTLDIIELYLQSIDKSMIAQKRGTKIPSSVLNTILKLLVVQLKKKQSINFLTHIYATLRSFVTKYPHTVFSTDSGHCGHLCTEVLRHCNYQEASVRALAAAFLYILMLKNFQYKNNTNFTRVKVQVTVAVAKLVGNSAIKDPRYLALALDSVKRYAHLAKKNFKIPKIANFATEVEAIIKRLIVILEDSAQILSKQTDQETRADLYHRIAASYSNAPDLRVTWLEGLASHHKEKNSWAEAAQCHIHMAALIAEYLSIVEPDESLPMGCAAFEKICPSCIDEANLSSSTLDDETACATSNFTVEGLVTAMTKSIGYFRKAKLDETVAKVYKLLLPIYEKNRDFESLAKAHSALTLIYRNMLDAEKSPRLTAAYYRVGFYGNKFGPDLNGNEFIYKTKPLTRLGEIQERLDKIFTKKLGPEAKVKFITSSGAVDPGSLDASYCWLQITSVDPYLEDHELAERQTQYERNYNICRFIFETPCQAVKNSDSPRDLYLVKTILTVEKSFPYMKSRIKIVDRAEKKLTPLTTALEQIEKRTAKLMQEVERIPADSKTMTLLLQGAVRTSVHAGPTAIAKAFLSNPSIDDHESAEKLRAALRLFLRACAMGLAQNKANTADSQMDLHNEFESGFKQIREEMRQFLGDVGDDDDYSVSESVTEDSASLRSARGEVP